MRICCWTERYWPIIGGIAVLVSKLLCSLSNLGHEFVVVTGKDGLDQPDYEEFNKVAIHRFPFHQLTANRDIASFAEVGRRLSRLRREFAPELIHMHGVFPGSMFYVVSLKNPQLPLLLTLHRCLSSPHRSEDTLLLRVMRSARWVTGCSAAVLKEAQSVMPQLAGRCSVIYNGLPHPGITPPPLPMDPPQLLCLGRLSPEKGFDLAISAFARLAGDFPKLRMVLAGDGPARTDLEEQADTLALGDRIDFLGWVPSDSVFELISQATILVIPSRTEGLPLVAIEAMLTERPVVATRVGGLPEAVEDGQTGLLVEEDDLQGLVGAVAQLLENPSRAEQMGRAGRRRSLERFNWDDHVVAEYNALYHKLAEEV